MRILLALLAAVLAAGGGTGSFVELNNQAVQLFNQGRYAEAEPLYRRALEAAGQGPGGGAALAITKSNLGNLLRVTGRYAEAGRLLAAALAEMEALPGIGTVNIERTLSNLVALHRATGDLDRAERFAQRLVRLCDEHPETRASERPAYRLLLAAIYADQRRFDDARAILVPAAESLDGPPGVSVHNSLSAIAIAQGRYEEARAFASAAVERARATLPAGHPATAAALNNLAQACRFLKLYADAERRYREAIGEWENAVGPSHPDLARGLLNMASFFHERHRERAAEELYRRSAAIFERTLGPGNVQTVVARSDLADVLRSLGRYTESRRLGETTLGALEASLEPDDPRVVRARAHRRLLLEAMEAPRER